MSKISMLFGAFLIIVGVAGYYLTGATSVTALIPAFIGIALALLGSFARKENLRKHVMHAAAMVGLIGILGTARGIVGLLTELASGEPVRPAFISMTITFLLCTAFVALCVRSFIQARKQRETPAPDS